MPTFGFKNCEELEVGSSSVRAFSHNKEDKKLRVRFHNGGVYEYANVTEKKLMKAGYKVYKN